MSLETTPFAGISFILRRLRFRADLPNGAVRHCQSSADQRAVGRSSRAKRRKAYECMVSQEGLSVRGRFKRQPHIKLCAIGTRAEVDFSVMPFNDDPVANDQAESRA